MTEARISDVEVSPRADGADNLVASVFCFSTLDEALIRANGVEYGLSASIFTSALATAQRFVGAVQAGVIHVNSTTTGAEVYVPFGA